MRKLKHTLYGGLSVCVRARVCVYVCLGRGDVQEEPQTAESAAALRGVWDPPGGHTGRTGAEGRGGQTPCGGHQRGGTPLMQDTHCISAVIHADTKRHLNDNCVDGTHLL